MRGWWHDLTDLVLPADCAGCGAPRTALCPRCRAALDGAAARRARPAPEPAGLPAVYAVAPYADEVRALLLAHKERGALALAGALGTALAGAARAGLDGQGAAVGPAGRPGAGRGAAVGSAGRPGAGRGAGVGTAGWSWRGPVLLVPVPSARWAVRARGHDPVRRMALAAAGELRRTGTPARVAAVLRQRRAVADQAGLDARRRLENVAGALEVAAGGARLLGAGPVVLVDDLMTTGATLAEAARALREATVSRRDGGPLVYAAVTREGREERRIGARTEWTEWMHSAPEMAVPNALGQVLHAAVIAAPLDSLEITRN
ncbi:ComF family protein [Streptomyces actinomycinicus]|uniref:ComF family protein n=1 Tax=Streptomyces actinomycinicus TaxID=1695166 RepID=A0A937JQV4_9ACTN|nr:ComF family protein [Streptomyces actinomycinicus]MBL1087100.1 ComF family protein [Streptomyces actinomycinicus]